MRANAKGFSGFDEYFMNAHCFSSQWLNKKRLPSTKNEPYFPTCIKVHKYLH